MGRRTFAVGDWVVANHHRGHLPGQITAVVTLHDFDGKKPLYRIDFGRFELHLTAEEISPDAGRETAPSPLRQLGDVSAPTTAPDWNAQKLWKRWGPPRNYIAGEASYKHTLTELVGPVREYGYLEAVAVYLIRDRDNPYDSNAFRAELNERLIGYLRRHLAAQLAPHADRLGCTSFEVPGIIRGGTPAASLLGCHIWLEHRLGPGPHITLGPDPEWDVPWPPYEGEGVG